MVKSITLTASMRSNLNSLKNISKQMNTTQERLSTGKKVNSAIDNASSYYQARALTNRASDLDALLDAMGQGIQTIQAATQGLTSGVSFLEQASAVANEALSQIGNTGGTASLKPIEDFIADGYTVVGTEAELNAAVATAGAKIVLSGDITLTSTLRITAENVTLDGNGHKISYTAKESGKSAIEIDGRLELLQSLTEPNTPVTDEFVTLSDKERISLNPDDSNTPIRNQRVTINNLKIEATGEKIAGIRVLNYGKLTLDNTFGITVSGKGAQKLFCGNADVMDLYDGQTNTKAILNQIGEAGLAASATNQFYVGDKNGAFGQGKWYLPSIGEWMEFYGTNIAEITGNDSGNIVEPIEGSDTGAETETENKVIGSTGAMGRVMAAINNALNILAEKGVDAEALSGWYWSSSEYDADNAWKIDASLGSGYRDTFPKYKGLMAASTQPSVRCAQLLKDCFDPSPYGTAWWQYGPMAGLVMYEDKTFSPAKNYDGSKKIVGVVANVSEDGRDVTIINLKDLTFDGNNFNPENPYGEANSDVRWCTSDKKSEDISGVQNFNEDQFLTAINSTHGIQSIDLTNTSFPSTSDTPNTPAGQIDTSLIDQYNKAFEQYDRLINDSSYQGVNLLKNEKLDVVFNETRNNKLTVQGKDMSSAALGLTKAEWTTQGDIANSIQELLAAVNKIRTFQSELGNNYSIIQTRQNFTEALTDVLETGADNLVLADMNEESANYLALQTRQQLATSALSLATNSAQSVLALFG